MFYYINFFFLFGTRSIRKGPACFLLQKALICETALGSRARGGCLLCAVNQGADGSRFFGQKKNRPRAVDMVPPAVRWAT